MTQSFVRFGLIALAALTAGCRDTDAEKPTTGPPPAAVKAKELKPPDRTIRADFTRFPVGEEILTVTLPDDAFPRGTSVTLRPAEQTLWQFEETRFSVDGSTMEIKVSAPDELRLAGGSFEPSLDIAVTVEQEGRQPQSSLLRVGPADDLVRQVTAEPETVDVSHFDGKITIDGDLSEWKDVEFLWLPYHEAKSQTARFCWREEGLYGSVTVPDSSIEPNLELTHTGDALELWIESNLARSLDYTRNPYVHKFVFLPDARAGDGGKAHVQIVMGRFATQATPIAAACKVTAEGYDLEFLLPAEVLAPAKMAAGTKMGFHFVLFDHGSHVEEFVASVRYFFRKPYLWGAIRLKGGTP